nr:unnamed protein product [Callosobruchus analis]
MASKQNYYSNPAFCQQSEFVGAPPRALSPQGSIRQSPVGAQTIPKVHDTSFVENDADEVQEQEFYEEVVVDDQGFITDKKVVVVAQNNEGKKYIQVSQNEDRYGSRYQVPQEERKQAQTEELCGSKYRIAQSGRKLTGNEVRYGSMYQVSIEERKGSRYGVPQGQQVKLRRSQSQRYEYIPMQEQDSRTVVQRATPKKLQYREEQVEVSSGKIHRYAVIEPEEETDLSSKNQRYALVPVDHLSQPLVVNQANSGRYEYIQDQLPPQSRSRYEYIQSSPPRSHNRYEYIQQSPRAGNPVATQKLHELLSTPRKAMPSPVMSPQSQRRILPQISPIPKESFQSRTPQRPPSKAQQKLNYALGTRQLVPDKRTTAVVAPICSSPIQSVYSETTFSKSGSWMNVSLKKTPVQATLTVAATMMFLCGAVTTGLCFYMISVMGRQYFLDFGVIAGFTCFTLGMLGYRSRNVYWLPNRNYISGYLLLSVFSLLTSTGLLVLLTQRPRPGTPLADVTSGAVCGVAALSLALAAAGVVATYCCRYPPPDNRVQHCAEGFSV